MGSLKDALTKIKNGETDTAVKLMKNLKSVLNEEWFGRYLIKLFEREPIFNERKYPKVYLHIYKRLGRDLEPIIYYLSTSSDVDTHPSFYAEGEQEDWYDLVTFQPDGKFSETMVNFISNIVSKFEDVREVTVNPMLCANISNELDIAYEIQFLNPTF